MATIQQKSLSSDRVQGPPSANVDLLECSICHDILWKPVACQTCETSFCSACINRWLANNPNKCPNQCETYVERKCPPITTKLLSQLQISCNFKLDGCQEVQYISRSRRTIQLLQDTIIFPHQFWQNSLVSGGGNSRPMFLYLFIGHSIRST
jgi:hypothetical protein